MKESGTEFFDAFTRDVLPLRVLGLRRGVVRGVAAEGTKLHTAS